MNTNKMTLGSGSKAKLLAAFAVLAVAFVVLAAVPAAVTSIDADSASTSSVDGYGPINFGNSYVGPISGSAEDYEFSNSSIGNRLIISYDDESKTYAISGTVVSHDSPSDGAIDGNAIEKSKASWVKMGMGTNNVIVYESDTWFKHATMDGENLKIVTSNAMTGKMIDLHDNAADNSITFKDGVSGVYINGLYVVLCSGEDHTEDLSQCYKLDVSGVDLGSKTDTWGLGYVGFTTPSPANVAKVTGDGETVYFNTVSDAWYYASWNSIRDKQYVIDVYEGQGTVATQAMKTVNDIGNIVLNINGNTLDIQKPAVGSTGTENQAFQLLKGNTVVMNNGTITSTDAAVVMLINNYCDLTLNDIVLDGRALPSANYGQKYYSNSGAITMASNNGVVNIKGSTSIYASEVSMENKAYALQINWYVNGGYSDGTQTTIDTTGQIEGIYFSIDNGTNYATKSTLSIENATCNGDVHVDSDLNDKEILFVTGEFKVTSGKVDVDAYLSEGAKIVLESGVAYDAAASYTVDGVESSAEFADVKTVAKTTIAAGSIYIDGVLAPADSTGTITVSGDAKVTGKLDAGMTLKVDSGMLTIPENGSLSVSPGAFINVERSAEITVSEKAQLSIAGQLSGKVTNKGTVQVVNGGNTADANITDVGKGKTVQITDDSDKENVNIDGIIKGKDNSYDANQIVTIIGDTKLDNNAALLINGTLVVKEGVTLTLTAGSSLILDSNAVLDVQGAIVVEEEYSPELEAASIVILSGAVNIYGTIDLNGNFGLASGKVVVEQDGVLNILSEGYFAAYSTGCEVVVKASGLINMNGFLDVEEIENNGTIIFDSEVALDDIIIIDMKNGAVLDIQKVTVSEDAAVKIDVGGDDHAAIYGETEGTPATGASIDAIISGLRFTETTTTSKNASGATITSYTLAVSGNISVAPVYTTEGDESDPTDMKAFATLVVAGSSACKLKIAEELTIGENITLLNIGTLEVDVAVDALKGAVENGGTITVSGNGSIISKKSIEMRPHPFESVINASMYEIAGTTASDKTYNYVTLDAALAAAASGTTKKIDVLGTQTLAASAELVTGATLNVDGATVTIGSGDTERDVVLTVRKGATVTGASSAINVNGTVLAEKKTDLRDNVRTALTAGADVYTAQLDDKGREVRDGWAKWTNVATAMADPEVTIVKLTRDLIIKNNLTIPEGKTLDTNTKDVTAEKNVVVTVEGTLAINGGSAVTLTTVDESATSDKSASIVVKGLVQSDAEIDIKTSGHSTEGIILLGAYYALDGKYCMTTVEKAAAIISTVDEQTVEIKGTEDKLTVAGDIAFIGKAADEMAKVNVLIKEIAFSGSVSIDNAVISFPADAKISGTFSNASGSVALKGQTGSALDVLSIASETKNGTAVLTVKGKLTSITTTTSSGTTTEKQTFTVTGAVTIDNATMDYVIVDGTLTVKNNNIVNKDLKVNGAVSISAGAKFSASDKATVLGTIAAAPATTSPASAAGEFFAKVLFVGIEEGAIYSTGAAATITGTATISDYALVAPGSEPESLKTSAYKSTEFYKDGVLYVTGYAVDSTNGLIKNVKVAKDNAYLKGWVAEGMTAPVANDAKIGSVSKVNAVFDTEVYSVKVIADSAVDNLYIDGNLMTKSGTEFTIVGDAKLAAGQHTFNYTLKNGYSGNGTFKIVSQTGGNSTISGSTLTLSGTPTSADGITIELQLTGFTASGYVDPVTPVTPSEDKDDGLTITDYLLIVLVVLIVIMAVIVAMRLMRS